MLGGEEMEIICDLAFLVEAKNGYCPPGCDKYCGCQGKCNGCKGSCGS